MTYAITVWTPAGAQKNYLSTYLGKSIEYNIPKTEFGRQRHVPSLFNDDVN
jgi:hypothetical protein